MTAGEAATVHSALFGRYEHQQERLAPDAIVKALGASGAYLWAGQYITDGSGAGYRATVTDTGALELRDGDGDVLWSSLTSGATSSDYRVVVQNDGNFALYGPGSTVVWHIGATGALMAWI